MAIDLKKIDPDLVYPLKEVAQILQVSYGTILKLRKEERIRSIKIGGKYYIRGHDVLKYIHRGESGQSTKGKDSQSI